MTDKDKIFSQRWEITKKLGILKFSMIYGGIWGVAVGFFSYIFNRYIFEEQDAKLWGKIVFFIVSGVLVYGPLLWWWSNRKYNKIMEKHKNDK